MELHLRVVDDPLRRQVGAEAPYRAVQVGGEDLVLKEGNGRKVRVQRRLGLDLEIVVEPENLRVRGQESE